MKNKKQHRTQQYTHGFCLAVLLAMSTLYFVPLYAEDTAQSAGEATSPTAHQPTITIGGKDFMTVVKASKQKKRAPIPESLFDGISQHYLNHPVFVMPYKHSPQRGDINSKITVIEFSDLGCLECMPQLQEVDMLLEEFQDKIRFVHVYAPTATSSAVQLAPFYGKIAQSNGHFWDYRKQLQSLTSSNANTFFNLLVNLGLNQTTIRRATITESRRFYQELDADAALTRKKKIGQSPLWLVNGVKVAKENAIPIAKLKDLLHYEEKRVALEGQSRRRSLKRNTP